MLKHNNLKAHGEYIRALLTWAAGDPARREIYIRRARYVAACVKASIPARRVGPNLR